MNSIRIVGGGLAGLSLGIALRNAQVPVTISEATAYPRHRVCGEFISGAGQRVLESMNLGTILEGATTNVTTAWFKADTQCFAGSLPAPARGLSRFELDARLARRFEELGGRLITRTLVRTPPSASGTVWAFGRRGRSPNWIGLKLHCRGLPPIADLTMHLGTHGYVGISRIEHEKLNICGLFRLRRRISPGKAGMMEAYLRANGLDELADQLSRCEIDPDSMSATTALRFTAAEWPSEAVCIGDAHTAIPPFTGNGMSMAFESARAAFPHLLRYATGERSWEATRHTIRLALTRRFRTRLAMARLLHPALLHPAGQHTLAWAASHQFLPFHLLYRLLR